MEWELLVQALILAGLVLLICQWNSMAKYYVKFTVFYAFVSVFSVVVIILSLPTPRDPRNFRYMTFFFGLCRYLLGIHWEVRGKENLKSDGPFVMVCNQQSSLDFLGSLNLVPSQRRTFVATKGLLYTGTFGLACWLCGIIFINRHQHDSAIHTMVNTGRIIKKENLVVWIFPEGRKSPRKEMLRFKSGAFHLAVQTQVPVVPIVFSAYHFLDSQNKRFNTGSFIITVLPQVQTVGLTSDDVSALKEKVQNQMVNVFEATSSETKCL